MMQSTDRSTKVVDSYPGTPERPDHCLTGEAGDLKRTTRPSVRSETIAADDNARDAGRSPLRALERQPSRNASWPPGHGPDSPIDNGGPVFSDGRRPRQNDAPMVVKGRFAGCCGQDRDGPLWVRASSY
jgi:hypothetical protein